MKWKEFPGSRDIYAQRPGGKKQQDRNPEVRFDRVQIYLVGQHGSQTGFALEPHGTSQAPASESSISVTGVSPRDLECLEKLAHDSRVQPGLGTVA